MVNIVNNSITLTRGDTCVLKLNVVDVRGENYTLQSGDKLTFTLRKKVSSVATLLEKTLEENILSLNPSDTLTLDFGDYVYDIVLKTATGEVFTVVPTSIFRVASEVHN